MISSYSLDRGSFDIYKIFFFFPTECEYSSSFILKKKRRNIFFGRKEEGENYSLNLQTPPTTPEKKKMKYFILLFRRKKEREEYFFNIKRPPQEKTYFHFIILWGEGCLLRFIKFSSVSSFLLEKKKKIFNLIILLRWEGELLRLLKYVFLLLSSGRIKIRNIFFVLFSGRGRIFFFFYEKKKKQKKKNV